MKISDEDNRELIAFVEKTAKEIFSDNNRLAKCIASFVRNGIEGFHADYLSDEQMRELNPLIRNAIYTFLVDFKREMPEIASDENIKCCIDYVIKNTRPFLSQEGLTPELLNTFYESVADKIDVILYDTSKGGKMLVGQEMIFVPKYWEDCIYIKQLKSE